MKRKSVMMFLSVLVVSSMLTACDKPLKIGPITLGKQSAETTAPESETPMEFFYGDVTLGTTLTIVECENIMMANGIDPTQCPSYLFYDMNGMQVTDITFDMAGTFSCKVLYQVGDEVREIPFTINVVDTGSNAGDTEATEQVTQETSGFLGYDITYPSVSAITVSEEAPMSIAVGDIVSLEAGAYIDGSVKEDASTECVIPESTSSEYMNPVHIYTGIALASQNLGITVPEGTEYLIYGFVDTMSMKDSTDSNNTYFVYLPEVVMDELDIENETKTYKDTGIEYDAGVASAILSTYGSNLTSKLLETRIVANVEAAQSQEASTTEEVSDDMMEEINNLPTDVIEEAPVNEEVAIDNTGNITDQLTYTPTPESYRDKYPEAYAWPASDIIYSRWDFRVDGNTSMNKVIILPDGTTIPEKSSDGSDYTEQLGLGKSNNNSSEQQSNQQTQQSNQQTQQTQSFYELAASYSKFKITETKELNLMFDSSTTADEVVFKNGANKYHVGVVPLNVVKGYEKTNMFTESTKAPKDSSKYEIAKGQLIERDGYNIQEYKIKYIDEGSGYTQNRLYMVTVIPVKAPSDVLVICGTDISGEFDESIMEIAKNCVEVKMNN